jgi:hypothetical protein
MEQTMPTTEMPTVKLHGMYCDVLRGPDGRVIWDRGWTSNTIVTAFRNLLATFVGGVSPTVGIQGLRVGQGVDAWDTTGPPAPTPAQTALVDPNPYLAPKAALQINYLSGGSVSTSPTNRLQIVATLGPNMPSWPDPNHVAANLREFGLVGTLNGVETLMNYVTHPVIVKDPSSTLTRTIWLVF